METGSPKYTSFEQIIRGLQNTKRRVSSLQNVIDSLYALIFGSEVEVVNNEKAKLNPTTSFLTRCQRTQNEIEQMFDQINNKMEKIMKSFEEPNKPVNDPHGS